MLQTDDASQPDLPDEGSSPPPRLVAAPRRFGGRDLTTGPIGRVLLAFAVPLLAGNVLQSLNGSVNAIWVGHYLGEAAISATSNANIVLFFLLGLVFGIGMAATILVGQAVGAGDLALAKRVLGTGLSFFLVLSVVTAAAGYAFSAPILSAMRTPPDAVPFAIAYLRIIFLALPFMYVSTLLTMTLRGAGDSTTPFWIMLLAIVLDIGLNPLLIFGWGPIPRFGIAGSAAATLVSQAVSLVALLGLLYRRNHVLALASGERRYLVPDLAILRSLLLKGFPMGLQMVMLSGSAIAMISLVNGFGTETTAAYGVATQLWTYVQMPAVAIGASVSSMAAQNVGAGRWDRVFKVTGWGLGYSVVLTGIPVILLMVFGRAAVGLFLPGDAGAVATALHINAVVTWSFILFGMTMVLFGVVRATGAVVPPLVILFVSLWVIRVPFATVLADRWGADAIWWSFPVGSVLSLALGAAYYRYGGWRRARMLSPTPRGAAPETGLATPVEVALPPQAATPRGASS